MTWNRCADFENMKGYMTGRTDTGLGMVRQYSQGSMWTFLRDMEIEPDDIMPMRPWRLTGYHGHAHAAIREELGFEPLHRFG